MDIKLHNSSDIQAHDTYSVPFEALRNALSNLKCANHFDGLLNMTQAEQKKIVDDFKRNLRLYLQTALPTLHWSEEFSPTDVQKDAIDIFGSNDSCNIVIEIDKHRADQVAKKFVSRNAIFADKRIIYVALCYRGTDNMNVSECIKYFGYCNCISKSLNNLFIGCIITQTVNKHKIR